MMQLQPMQYANIRRRLLGCPLMMTEDHAQAILTTLAPRLGIVAINGMELEPQKAGAEDIEARAQIGGMHPDSAYARDEAQPFLFHEGTAIIPVHGTIVQRHSIWNSLCDNCSTEALAWSFAKASASPMVKNIFLDIDSPGGEVSGTFDAVDAMMAMKRHSRKPVHAHANELAASAAYAIASVADHLSTPRTGFVGSVGVIWLHAEMSRLYEKNGIAVTVIRKGDQKANTNSVEPLSAEGRAFMEASVADTYDLFVHTVIRNRGALTQDAVVGTQSRLLRAAEAPDLGFIDAVMSQEEAFNLLARTG